MRITIRKPSKYVRHYGFELELEKELSDQELRLFHVYKLIVDWDRKHEKTFGFSEITIRQLQEIYLPSWSIGKISSIRQSLISKKWLNKRGDGMIGPTFYLAYRIKDFQQAEQHVQDIRSGVQSVEIAVPSIEQPTSHIGTNYFREGREMLKGNRLSRSDS